MSKSRRVFLSMQDDDDFWDNGDRIEEEKKKTSAPPTPTLKPPSRKHQQQVRKLADKDDEEEMADKYFFKQNANFVRPKMLDEVVSPFKPQRLQPKQMNPFKNDVATMKSEEKTEEEVPKTVESTDFDEKSAVKSSLSGESSDTFYNNYRNFFRGRAEVHQLIRSLYETSPETVDNKFIDLYEKTRKKLEAYPNPHINQILRRTVSNATVTETRVRNKHAVVVSNFREPDRRLGRYSKYYYHHNVGPEVYSRKVFVGGLPACVSEGEILDFFTRYGRLQVDWPSKHYGFKSDSDPSLCSEMMANPTSHLSMPSPPFGQVNPFANDSSEHPRGNGFYGGSGGGNSHGFGGGIGSGMGWSPGGVSQQKTSDDGKRQQHLGYVFLLFEKERSVRDLVAECFEEEEGLFITLESSLEPIRVQIRPWLLADAEFLMDFNVAINTKLVAFIGGVPRPLKAVELAHFFEQTYGNVVCVGIDIDNKFKYPRGSGRVAFSNYDAYVQAITDRYIVLDHEDIHKRVEIKPYFFHNQTCEECSGRYHRQHAPFFCPSLECFQYYCEPCWHKMHAHPSRFHHMPIMKGV